MILHFLQSILKHDNWVLVQVWQGPLVGCSFGDDMVTMEGIEYKMRW